MTRLLITRGPCGHHGRPGHARGRDRDHLLLGAGRGVPAGDRGVARSVRRRPVRGVVHASRGRRPQGRRGQARDLRSGDPRQLADRRGFRRPPTGGTHVAGARPHRFPGRGGRLLTLKYPRTFHLPDSPGASADDRIQRDLSWLDGELVVTEKLDGGNLTFTRDAMYGRSPDSGTQPWDRPAKALWAMTAYRIPDAWRGCGGASWAPPRIAGPRPPGGFLVLRP